MTTAAYPSQGRGAGTRRASRQFAPFNIEEFDDVILCVS
jgi:hypothetical protein